MKKKLKKPSDPDYEVVKLPEDIVAFGITLFIRKDKQAFKIDFSDGQSFIFVSPLIK